MKSLRKEFINTWFDLGIFIDQLRSKPPKASFSGNLAQHKKLINDGGIGIVSFYFTVDGITVEASKYADAFQNIYPQTKIHYIAGAIHDEASSLINSPYKKVIKEMNGFDNCAKSTNLLVSCKQTN